MTIFFFPPPPLFPYRGIWNIKKFIIWIFNTKGRGFSQMPLPLNVVLWVRAHHFGWWIDLERFLGKHNKWKWEREQAQADWGYKNILISVFHDNFHFYCRDSTNDKYMSVKIEMDLHLADDDFLFIYFFLIKCSAPIFRSFSIGMPMWISIVSVFTYALPDASLCRFKTAHRPKV